MLDVACGNGALARYLDHESAAENRSIQYVGVDSARIKPPDAKGVQGTNSRVFIKQEC